MERKWTKRKLPGLYQGDGETVRQWQSQYGRYIYTWLYYQLDKDESQAATLTGQVLSQALVELSAFDPEQTTMYLWLKESAARQLQTFLAQSGQKVQRPWAWSEIPPAILDSLKRIRNEPVVAEASGCSAVVEMLQATLSDLSEQDRELLIRRYTRLDTVEHIGSEAGLSAEKVNQQLYLARHAFRRGLFFLLQSANPDVAEPTVSGGTELFESNLEVLLRSVNASAMISSTSAEHIKRAVLGAASKIAENPCLPASNSHNQVLKPALASAVILILAGAILLWMTDRSEEPGAAEPPLPESVQASPGTAEEAQGSQIEQEELKRVLDMGVRGDVAGLLGILKSGRYISQVTAAHYLGQLGDDSAIEPLLEAQARWYPDEPLGNPFSQAVETILERLAAAEGPVEPAVTEAPTAVEEPAVLPEPEAAVSLPALSGRIVDYSGAPLSGVTLALHRDSAAESGSVPIAGFSATTDAEGRYAFDTLPEGMFVVVVRDPEHRVADSRRMMYASTAISSTLDFGGSAAVSGAILIDDVPSSEQTVLLSDHFENPGRGAFTAETQTDADGGFVFTGVPAGQYGLFTRLIANRWTLLGQVEAAGADVSAVFDVPTVTLVVRTEALGELLEIAAVSLRYSADSGDALAEWTGVRTESDAVFELRRVVPGVYVLCADFSNGVRTLREVVVSGEAEQDIFIEDIPLGTAGMSGRFLSDWEEGLTLECAEPAMRIGVMPEEDGYYTLSDVPAGMYSLGVRVNGVFVPILEFGLFEAEPAAYDPDPVQLAASRSPVYIYVTDAEGRGLAGGQVWLAGAGGFYAAQPLGRGYFAAVPAGGYSLTAVFAGYAAAEEQVAVPVSTVQAPQSEGNTHVLRLGR